MMAFLLENDMDKKCKVEGCERKVKSRGYCGKHYSKLRYQGFFGKEIEEYKNRIEGNKNRRCSVLGCNRKYYAKGYCHLHYVRFVKYGDPDYTMLEFHGMVETPEYTAWGNMKDRCYNKNYAYYQNYGGRGIKVCQRWLDSFMNFFHDMGIKPSQDMQLDRINNNGNYEPDNCRWVTSAKNTQNRRNTVLSMGKARKIRIKHSLGVSNKDLSIEFGCSTRLVLFVVNNEIWKEEAQA
jgi:hypothetical protein